MFSTKSKDYIYDLVMLFFLMTWLVGCVGTVEDKNPKQTKAAESNTSPIPFNGLTEARGVAHDKIELYWYPAPGSPSNLVYEIFVNNAVVPMTIPAASLVPNSNGQLSYTVTNRAINTTFDMSVGVKNLTEGSSSENNKSMEASTFANLTADFMGVSNVRVPAGSAGKTSLVVEWVPASKDTIADALPYPQDPVGYEVRWINTLHGNTTDLFDDTNSDIQIKQYPTVINSSTPASNQRTATITGLNSGDSYFFAVRAIHKAFVDYGHISSYKKEQNRKFYRQTTTSNTGVFSLTSDVLTSAPPKAGADQLTKRELSWSPATGAFQEYRVYWKIIADADGSIPGVSTACVDTFNGPNAPNCKKPDPPPAAYIGMLTDQLTDVVIDAFSETPLGDADEGFKKVGADETYTIIENLASYGYYQFKVRACDDTSCNNPIPTLFHEARVEPTLAPFTGINTILNPEDTSPLGLRTIKINMDPPVVTSGYVDRSEVYCLEDEGDATPVLMPNDGSPVVDGITACNGARMKTPTPTTLSGFTTYNEIEIELDTPFVGSETISSKRYCFAVVPFIDGNYGLEDVFDYPLASPSRDLSTSVVKCIVPEIKVPTIEDFPGKNLGCSVSGDDINVTWQLPTEGQYTNFVVFWKEKNATNFKFSDAVADIGTQAVYQNSIDKNGSTFLNNSATAYTISNLQPGKRYNFGVLAFIDDATPSDRKFSEYNIRTDDCLVPFPKAEFKELMNIFAVGPKENGLADYNAGKRPSIVETLDSEGLPVEVKLVDDIAYTDLNPTTEFTERYGDVVPGFGKYFNGVYGTVAGKDPDTDGRFKYSNSGMVSFAFKDFQLDDGLSLMDHAVNAGQISAAGAILGNKIDITYGYKIYRSDDGKATWTDLTGGDTSYQDPNNYGLITSADISYRKRNDKVVTTYKGVIFTDYSVSAEDVNPSNPLVSRAKVLYYKIVPIYNNTEIVFVDETLTDNIIKITLPPANMALVDRRIANRTICEEMGKPILTGGKPNKYYSCFYNGLGSSGLSSPWQVGSTVYDIGGDLLVDRFELGCNFTRGDIQNQKSTPNQPAYSALNGFRGDNSSSSKFKGCWSDDSVGSIGPSNDDVADPGPFASGPFEVRNGDCLFSNLTVRPTSACAPGRSSTNYTFITPGLIGQPACDSGVTDLNPNSYFDVYENTEHSYRNNVAQSEFAAVAYSRARITSDGHRVQLRYRGSGDAMIIPQSGGYPSACMINLPSISGVDAAGDDDTSGDSKMDGRWKPRWIPLNKLDSLTHTSPTTDFDILDETINDILGNDKLYDIGGVSGTNKNNPPSGSYVTDTNSRYIDSTPLGRVMTSNASKLPPLGNLSQDLSHKICNQYEVEVGVGSGGGFVGLESASTKRLLRRKEWVAATAFSRDLDFQTTSETERGIRTVDPVDGASPLTSDNSSCNGSLKDTGAGQVESTLWVRDFITSILPYKGTGLLSVVADTLVLTGSSIYDGDSSAGAEPSKDKHTQKCQSKFGIQDMVGNTEEYTSDQIFCDFQYDRLMYGTTAGDPDSAAISNGTEYRASGGREVWPQPVLDSGRCSVNQVGSLRTGITPAIGISILPPYFSDGSNNAAILTEIKGFDKESVQDARNGDGYFLDFGFDSIGAPIKEHDTMGMFFDSTMLSRATAGISSYTGKTDPRRAKYFSPTLGIPIECEGTGCDTSTDNKEFSTEALLCRSCTSPMSFDGSLNLNVGASGCSCDDPALLGITDADFPVNNSTVISDGISEKSDEIDTHVRTTAPSALTSFSYIDINTGSSPYTLTTEGPMSTDNSVGPEPDVSTNSVWWAVSRDQPMYFKNGGYRLRSMSGRYTAHLRGVSPNSQLAAPESASRCAIKINLNGDY